MTATATRIVTDGFHLFAHVPTHLVTLILPEIFCLITPMSPEAIEVFRVVRVDKETRHNKSNISFDVNDGAIVLSEIFLTPEFGISVVADPALARFEFQPTITDGKFLDTFQFKTMDGFEFEPRCYYKLL
jgi:hypothetical protein